MTETVALFFLRSYPDIDHITPIVYKISNNTEIASRVIFVEYEQIPDDYRIEFLKKQDDVQLRLLSDVGSTEGSESSTPDLSDQATQRARESVRLIKNIGRKLPTDIPRVVWRTITPEISESEPEPDFPEPSTLFEEYNQYGSLAVLFDWPPPLEKTLGQFIQEVVTESKQRGISTAALPHGDEGYTNYIKYNHLLESLDFDLNRDPESVVGTNPKPIEYDYHVCPSTLRAQKDSSPVSREQIRILGSPRYNQDWIDINSRISPDYQPDLAEDSFNVLFFLAKRTMPVFWKEVHRTVKFVSKLQGTNLVIRGHPRSSYDDIKETGENSEYDFVVEDQSHSVSLLDWSDAVVSLGGSIDFSVVVRGLPLLELEYLHANQSTVASYADGVQIDCRDELVTTLKALRDDEQECTYSDEERQRLLDEMIAVKNDDPLEEYVNLIVEMVSD